MSGRSVSQCPQHAPQVHPIGVSTTFASACRTDSVLNPPCRAPLLQLRPAPNRVLLFLSCCAPAWSFCLPRVDKVKVPLALTVRKLPRCCSGSVQEHTSGTSMKNMRAMYRSIFCSGDVVTKFSEISLMVSKIDAKLKTRKLGYFFWAGVLFEIMNHVRNWLEPTEWIVTAIYPV